MNFKTLKDKCEYFRSLTDYKLTPNSYVIAMLDGRSFSKLIKNKYALPFDSKFISYMNQVAEYLCQNVQGAKFAYVQSDEISMLITDFDTPTTDAAFGYRICKLQSLLAAMAASKFNQLVTVDEVKRAEELKDDVPFDMSIADVIKEMDIAEFDCKVWNVPDYNTAFCHFLWRQNDCVRNSKQQAAQTYIPHKVLMGKNADEQVALLKERNGIDWETAYDDGKKYGRIIYKELQTFTVVNTSASMGTSTATPETYTRAKWGVHNAEPFGNEDNVIKTLIPKRNE